MLSHGENDLQDDAKSFMLHNLSLVVLPLLPPPFPLPLPSPPTSHPLPLPPFPPLPTPLYPPALLQVLTRSILPMGTKGWKD